MNRRNARQYFRTIGLAMASYPTFSFNMQNILRRQIASTAELLPCIGLGTWQTFDVGNSEEERGPLREILRTMVARGASVVDSSPMYGTSEKVVGDLSTEADVNDKLFIATKVWTSGLQEGKDQMNKSFVLLKRKKIDLMQIHNLMDWQTHLKTLQEWKEAGKIRYIGLTHYLDGMHEKMEDIIRKNRVDFIQINYSMNSRNAEKRLLPAAADNNVAVLINRPFEEGALFDRVKGKTLPAWAAEFDCSSWGQFFLKFILSNPHVTCAIPGTSKVRHMIDNLGAAMGKLPDKELREKMIQTLS
jgi:diketogulonate reductase-like aldo/keto reductase